MGIEVLRDTAQGMVSSGKGILAMDESDPTCRKRFASIGVECSEESRRAYRSMLIAAPGLGDCIAAAILFDETIRQDTTAGVPFPRYLQDTGIIPGIKVDKGARALAGHPGEKVTEGLDGLRERLQEYRELGARFAKWRAVITIGDSLPSEACIGANAHALARYAALCQEADIVPIVEPEVLMDGTHSIARCYEVTEHTQRETFRELAAQGVELSGIVLKPNMVVSGSDCPEQADSAEVARMTLKCLRGSVPSSVPGIAFLSGGMSDEVATANLDVINRLARQSGNAEWRITFSYGRALQQSALKVWRGDPENVPEAQRVIARRARLNGAASTGEYSAQMESRAA